MPRWDKKKGEPEKVQGQFVTADHRKFIARDTKQTQFKLGSWKEGPKQKEEVALGAGHAERHKKVARESEKTHFNFSAQNDQQHFDTTQSSSFQNKTSSKFYQEKPGALGKSKAKQFKKTNFVFGFRKMSFDKSSKQQNYKRAIQSRFQKRKINQTFTVNQKKHELDQIYGGGGFYNSRNKYDSVNKQSYQNQNA